MLRFKPSVHTALWGREEWLVSPRECPAFPLLVKRIVAERRLSVQVHPNEFSAKTVGGDPKTEMWCVLKDGPLFAGFRPGTTAGDVRRAIVDGSFEELLVRFDAKAGECYFIPGGLVHAIGEGTSVYEVQQPSETTFRLYDWGRLDADGHPRQLHVNEALATLDLSLPPPIPQPRVSCPYFTFDRFSDRDLEPECVHRAIYFPADGDACLLEPGESLKITAPAFVTTAKHPSASHPPAAFGIGELTLAERLERARRAGSGRTSGSPG